MAIYSKKEFSSLCGIETKNLSNYINRKNVIATKDGFIDDSVDKNRAFLAKRRSKSSQKKIMTTVSKIEKNKKTVQTEDESDENSFSDSHEGQTLEESQRHLKYLDTQKRLKEIEKLEIEIAKKKGEVIPSELIGPCVLQHNQSIITEFKNTADEIIRIIAKKKSLSVNEMAEIKGDLVVCINTSIQKATTLTANTIENIISDYSEKRGIGERNV